MKPECPQYVITRHGKGSLEPLCISLETGEKALPVFSFEELARRFLERNVPGSGWRVKEFHNGDLITLLIGPCANVEGVLPNPLPDLLKAKDALLNPVDRENFVAFLESTGQRAL